MPRARDCLRTNASSSPRYAGLTVTSVRPARAAPSSIITHCGPLAAQIATCSPETKRSSSARATFSDSVSNSSNVHRRRVCSSEVPSIRAVRVRHVEVAARSASPMEISRTGSARSAGRYDKDGGTLFTVTPRFQIGGNWLHLHCVMALRRRQGGSMRRRSFRLTWLRGLRQFSEASLRASPALTTALAVLIPSARYENRPILCTPKPHRFVEQRPSWSPMKESPARARAVSILKHRLNHRSAVSPPPVIRVGGYIEDANPITGQNAETGADRDSLFFSQPSRHPRSAQNG